ncbi:MAG: hypothetical protein AAF202_02565 [Pseudomonadota bacterium]
MSYPIFPIVVLSGFVLFSHSGFAQDMVQRFRWISGSPSFVTETTNADGNRLRCQNLNTRSQGYVIPNENGGFGPDEDGNVRVRFDRGVCRGHDAVVPAASINAFEPRRARSAEPVGVVLGESSLVEAGRRLFGSRSNCAWAEGTEVNGVDLNNKMLSCGVINGSARGVVVSTPNEDPRMGYSIVRVTGSSNQSCIGDSIYVPNRCIDDGDVGSSIAEGRLSETEEHCENCEAQGGEGVQSQTVEAIEAALNLPISLSNLTPLPQDLGRSQCENVVRSNGEPGQVGLQVLAAMRQHGDCYFNSGMTPHASVCGGFAGFNAQQKANFWVYTFAAIAKDRSNCTEQRSSRNGKFDGIFNLPYSWRDRRDQGMDPLHCSTSGPANSRDLGFQANCAVATLARDSCNFGARVGSGTSYWDNLQQSNGSISNILKRFPGCN